MHSYPLTHIYGGDETGMWLDGLNRTTVDFKGAHEVGLRTAGATRLPITILLAARADGHKLPALVLIPRKRTIKELEKFEGQLKIIYTGNKSWMDEEKCTDFVRTCIGRDLFGRRKLLVWDAFRPHFTPNIRQLCTSFNIDMAVIPGKKIILPLTLNICFCCDIITFLIRKCIYKIFIMLCRRMHSFCSTRRCGLEQIF